MEIKMKKILCFGDSNTYGYNPTDGSRYDKNTRWTGVLSALLCKNFEIIEAGLNNRCCFSINSISDEFTGTKIISKYLELNPDIVILAIGINDLQLFYNPTYEEIKNGISKLVSIVKNELISAEVILLAPPRLTNDVLFGNFSHQFDNSSIEKSLQIQDIYKNIAIKTNISFINLDEIIQVSKKDGLHFEPDAHKKIADVIYQKIISLS